VCPEPFAADPVRRLPRPDGAVVAYRLWRPGQPRRLLVLLHGVASNMSRWEEYVTTTRLREHWDLLRLDLRGHGLSAHRGPISPGRWAADLAAVLEAEGYRRAVVGGHCLGATIALRFALGFPERTAGLVLVEPMFRPALRGSMARLARLRRPFLLVAALVRGLNRLGLHRRRLMPLDLGELDRQTRDAMAAGPRGERFLARYASPLLDLRTTPVGAYLAGLLAVSGPAPDLAAVKAPVLALLSSASTFTDPGLTARLLSALPDCRIATLPARHWIPTEQPLAMRQAIEAWCLALPPDPA
jgi:pimeloyl-ACP methyl ester carboxylesterase